MNEEIINKLDEITSIIESDKEIKEYKKLKKDLLNNQELLDKISKLKQMDKYDNNYIELKKEILSDKVFERFTHLDKELFYDIKDINNKLQTLIEKRGCN